ncbi:MAG: hypothetical protein DHS20C06_09960 [Hyphobacterium sp.]|nr:MAG: hypothetical protein DHS20C06_09960 [Hyphobacterium sp.]
MTPAQPLYVPVLRRKQGECQGLSRLSDDIRAAITPCFVVPPPKDATPTLGRPPTPEEIVSGTGRQIGEYWRFREAYLDVRFLFKEFDGVSSTWLPRMFNVAREHNAHLIPVATLSDLSGIHGTSFLDSLAVNCSNKIAIRITADEFDDDLEARVSQVLSVTKLSPVDCAIFVDFGGSDFTDVSAVADIAQAALEHLQMIGLWGKIVFQGTNYPTVNPAIESQIAVVPRNEWLAWKAAVSFDASTAEHLLFGDFAADCAKFEFSQKGGGRAIRHYRYATPDSWLVVRGSEIGRDAEVMKAVSRNIVKHVDFAGRSFSSADEYIFQTSLGLAGPGNSTIWREINTAHHITRVVRDIGKVKGMVFKEHQYTRQPRQSDLFASTAT